MLWRVSSNCFCTSASCDAAFRYSGWLAPNVAFTSAKLLLGFVEPLGQALKGLALGGDLRGLERTGCAWNRRPLPCARGRPAALVYSVFNCNSRAERMLVFSSGLMTFNSRSNRASARLERSILAFNSSNCFSMKEDRLAEERMRML